MARSVLSHVRGSRLAAMSELARSPVISGKAHPAVRRLLARSYAGFTEATEPAGEFVLPATTSVLLILKIEDSVLRPPQFVNGVHGSWQRIEGECAPSYLEVWLAPLGAYAVLGLPMDELNGQMVDLYDVLEGQGDRLAEQVRDAPSWQRRFELIDEFLLRRMDRGRAPDPQVAAAWRRVVADGGAARIGAVAREVGWSHKHLIAKFRQQVGLTPKTASQLVRLERVWQLLASNRASRWEQIAVEAGYADQAHLIRDFRRFTGTSPTALLGPGRRGGEVNFVQDAAAVAS
ncbi:MAG TPA: helix-turn-helix domain-containing protein [Kribbella sp.]|nr:helix-turn-helix domain-containing protein [Kribbella sp.]